MKISSIVLKIDNVSDNFLNVMPSFIYFHFDNMAITAMLSRSL